MYRCYESSGNEDEAVNVLKDILSYDENYEDAVKALADIYYKKEDADNLTKLIRKYQDGKMCIRDRDTRISIYNCRCRKR